MIQFTVGTEIARPPSEVFAHVTDPAKLATWHTISAVAESDQPFGLGTRVREVHRAPGGKQLASLVEVSRIRARLRVRAADARRSATHPRPDHARTRQARHPRPARRARTTERPMRLAQPLLRLTLKRQFAGYCATLKQVLEIAPPGT